MTANSDGPESPRSPGHSSQARSSTPSVAVLIPCYNDAEGLETTLSALYVADVGDQSLEFIIVDDGSTEEIGAVVRQFIAREQRIELLRHRRNRGYGAALKTGLARTSAEVVAIIDADGTYPPDKLPALLRAVATCDMAVGARTGANVHRPLARRVPKWLLNRYAALLIGESIPDLNSGMRAFRRSAVLPLIRLLPDGFSFTTTLTLAMHYHHRVVEYVPINYYPRVGRSKIRPLRDTCRFFALLVRLGAYFAPAKVFLPPAAALFAAFAISLAYDLFVLLDLTEKTMLLFVCALNTALFGAIAELIARRSGS